MFDDLLTHGYFKFSGRWIPPNFGMDCYGLAIETRRRLLPAAQPMPDYPWVYKKWNRDTVPPDIIIRLLLKSKRVEQSTGPRLGDLVLLDGTKGDALGVFVGDNDGVIFFGEKEKPVIVPDWSIPNLNSYWRILDAE